VTNRLRLVILQDTDELVINRPYSLARSADAQAGQCASGSRALRRGGLCALLRAAAVEALRRYTSEI
jgi:hypothetical protein